MWIKVNESEFVCLDQAESLKFDVDPDTNQEILVITYARHYCVIYDKQEIDKVKLQIACSKGSELPC